MANLPQLTSIQALLDAVAADKTLKASIVTFLNQLTPFIQDKVTAALTADNAADADSIIAANAAIAGGVTDLLSQDSELAAAFAANVPAVPPTDGGTGNTQPDLAGDPAKKTN